MKTIRLTTVIAGSACLAVSLLFADWNVGDDFKMHYPQLPDESPTGLDVYASFPDSTGAGKILADDWMCTESGPVTQIHIWGSWLNDVVALDPVFHLSIHGDIPAGVEADYSLPDALIWEGFFDMAVPDPMFAVTERLYLDGVTEGFYDPNVDEIIGSDTMIFQYNFDIDPSVAFFQQQGNIYWLDAQVLIPNIPGNENALFGWKTSLDHFNDDAVFGDNLVFGLEPEPQFPGYTSMIAWKDMYYPAMHPLQGQSIDLAFVIVPEPSGFAFLFGLATLLGTLLRRRS